MDFDIEERIEHESLSREANTLYVTVRSMTRQSSDTDFHSLQCFRPAASRALMVVGYLASIEEPREAIHSCFCGSCECECEWDYREMGDLESWQ